MSSVCPNGHTSSADDYCDVCGTPIAATAGEPAVTPAPPAPASEASAEEAASTPVGPRPAAAAASAGGPPPAGASASPAESSVPATGESVTCPNCSTENAAGALFCEACGYDFTTGAVPSEPAASTPDVSAPLGPPLAADWVAEAWVDPDWYASQEVEDPCPSPGLPRLIPLRSTSVLLGRVSVSRNTHPEIDLSSDPGVSRRHAQLTTDGTRWFVEDLASSNGTYVGPASGPLPDKAIPVGPKTELGDDDRLYVGAWTRVVIRRATHEEVAQLA